MPGNIRYEKALLFGSRARGDYREDSDADLALIVTDPGDKWDKVGRLGMLSFGVLSETGVM